MQTELPTTEPSAPASAPRNRWLLTAAAALLVVAGVVAAVSIGDDGDTDVASGPPLELSLGAGDSLSSCMAFDVATLGDMPVAFGGTATAVTDDAVTLEVDRWFRGGDAEIVQLESTGGQAALIAGFDFVVGERYLITATDGTVNFCNFSGPATPQFESFFEDAFAS